MKLLYRELGFADPIGGFIIRDNDNIGFIKNSIWDFYVDRMGAEASIDLILDAADQAGKITWMTVIKS